MLSDILWECDFGGHHFCEADADDIWRTYYEYEYYGTFNTQYVDVNIM